MKAARITLCIAALCITGAASAQYQYQGITPSTQRNVQPGYQPPNYPVPNVREPGYGGDSRPATGIRPSVSPSGSTGMGARPGSANPSSSMPSTSGMGSSGMGSSGMGSSGMGSSGMGNRPALGTPSPGGPGLRVPGMGN